ncbi:hypothetical protein B4N89_13940 [Embleya scabrispora]|uniref:Uncharacterized protein n=1 Tax=Embleya scabrispora TaxID=159449 RepID=A0A1T3NYH2_9ACTN|nr:hypothetical protein [Embleya scabrispora]OPC81889.1 hypothetical protein B4N89_13940 [Embleya scabrispora]
MTEHNARDESVEDLLRAAMAARADTVTAHRLRPPAPPHADGTAHSRWKTIGLPLSAVLLAAAAVGGVSLVGAPTTNRSTPLQSRVPTPLTTESGTPSPGMTSAPPTHVAATEVLEANGTPESSTAESENTPPDNRPTTRPPSSKPASTAPGSSTRPRSDDVSAVKFRSRPSWRVVREDARHECVLADPAYTGDCLGHGAWVSVKPVPDVSGSWPSEGAVDKDDGGPTRPSCLRNGVLVTPPANKEPTMRLTTKSTVTVAGHPAKYRSWTVTCADAGSYDIRLWWLVDQGVYIHTIGLPAGSDIADRVVASLDLSGYKPPTS